MGNWELGTGLELGKMAALDVCRARDASADTFLQSAARGTMILIFGQFQAEPAGKALESTAYIGRINKKRPIKNIRLTPIKQPFASPPNNHGEKKSIVTPD